MTSSELGKVYNTLMCVPRMNEVVKMDLGLSRKLILLLVSVVENGLKHAGDSAVQYFPGEDSAVLNERLAEAMEKAGLSEVYQELKEFSVK